MTVRFHGRYTVNIPTSEPLSRFGDQAIRVGRRGGRVVLSTTAGREIARGNPIICAGRGGGRTFEIAGRRYVGDIVFRVTSGRLQAVNRVDLEAYVKGVVPAEMGRRPRRDFEALKAQAIAARTYAFMKIRPGKAAEYDVRADVSDQVYLGRPAGSDVANDAVDATYGQVITYRGEPVISFYHSTCGGRTASGSEVFAMNRAPYLTGVADNFGAGDFCRASPHYRWTSVFLQADIRRRLERLIPVSAGTTISDIRVDDRLPSGRVARLSASYGGRRLKVTAMQIRELFRSDERPLLRSSLFRILPARPGTAKISLVGAGSGHGVGMCQWGAIGMSRAGYDVEQILRHYYRDTAISRIY